MCIFTGKVIISLPSYVNLKSLINGNVDPVEKTFHMQSYTMHSASIFSVFHTVYVHFQNIQPHMFNRCHWAIFLPHKFLFTFTFTIHLQIDAVLL